MRKVYKYTDTKTGKDTERKLQTTYLMNTNTKILKKKY